MRHFSDYFTLHHGDIATWATPLDPRLFADGDDDGDDDDDDDGYGGKGRSRHEYSNTMEISLSLWDISVIILHSITVI